MATWVTLRSHNVHIPFILRSFFVHKLWKNVFFFYKCFET